MKEYSIHINFTVDARDYDEAVEIAKAVRAVIMDGVLDQPVAPHCYRVRDVETPHGGIEEL